jgi:hypothetical protein
MGMEKKNLRVSMQGMNVAAADRLVGRWGLPKGSRERRDTLLPSSGWISGPPFVAMIQEYGIKRQWPAGIFFRPFL